METAGWFYLDIITLFRNEPDNWIAQSALQSYLLYRARSSGFLSAPKTVCIANLWLQNHSWGFGKHRDRWGFQPPGRQFEMEKKHVNGINSAKIMVK